MGDFLNPVKTTKKVKSNIEKFESLTLKENGNRTTTGVRAKRPVIEVDTSDKDEPVLNATKSKSIKTERQELDGTSKAIEQANQSSDLSIFREQRYLNESDQVDLPDKALKILKSQAGIEDLEAVLKYLRLGVQGLHKFNIRITGPKESLIVKTLVTTTIPDLWRNLRQTKLSILETEIRNTLLEILTSVAGLEALCFQLQNLAQKGKEVKESGILDDYFDVLASLLAGSKVVIKLLNDAKTLYEKEIQRRLFWQGVTSLLGGSKILTSSALAESYLANDHLRSKRNAWLSDGSEYSRWLARNIVAAATHLSFSDGELWKFLGQLFKRGLSLGHRDMLVAELYSSLLLGSRALWTPLQHLLQEIPPYDQRAVFNSILNDLSRRYFGDGGTDIMSLEDLTTAKAVSGVSALIRGLVSSNQVLEEQIMEWVSSSSEKHSTVGLGMRRALIVILAQSQDKLESILERTLMDFGDKLHIQHLSITHQEYLAQSILLSIGYLNRLSSQILKSSPISSLSMHAVSNRLASSIPRSRFLGMLLGVGMSRCIDQPDKVMNFGVEEMESEEAKGWLNLITLKDHIGDIKDLVTIPAYRNHSKPSFIRQLPAARELKKQTQPQMSKIVAIEELSPSSDDEEDLIPYQKPDDDPEDSDEDPTLINRNKSMAPVYILDLINQLNMTDKPEVTALALKTASSLIRRKANFGTEVSENIHALASALINIQEGTSRGEQQQQRLESLIACFIAKPQVMGRYLTEQYFSGDFSLSQRNMILTVLGLGARELAGFTDHGNIDSSPDFPSNCLPEHLKSLLTSPETQKPNPVSSLTSEAAHALIRPMALEAADSQSGPSALKIRTFSSRMDVEKRRSEQQKERTKRVPKNIHSILVNSIYIPLCSPMAFFLSSTEARRSNSTLLHPSTFRLYLQTLTLVLSTLGPLASLHLPTLTRETLLLLLALHSLPLATDPVVLPAMLHLLLTLIDMTVEVGVAAQERLIVDQGAQIAELVSWANGLSERQNIPVVKDEDGTSGMSWTVLAAGIAVKWMEIGKRFQGRMLGLTMDDDL